MKEATFQAWQTARFYLQGRSKKGMPPLSKALEEIGKGHEKPQTEGQMKAMLAIIAAQNKLTLRVEG